MTPSRRGLLAWSGAAGAAGLVAGGLGERALSGSDDVAADGVSNDGAAAGTTADADLARRLDPYDAVVTETAVPHGLDRAVPAFGQVIAADLSPSAGRSAASARRAAVATLMALAALADEADTAAEPAAATGLAPGAAAYDQRPSGLQVTPGFGPGLLSATGLQARRPEAWVDLPAFDVDRLDPQLSGGDLMVQVGADDPMRLAGAVQQVLTALAADWSLRWSRPGFRPTPAGAEDPRTTVRNLMGHRDGTANDPLGSPLWRSTVLATGTDWMSGGSYLVARRIRIDLQRWFDRTEQQRDRVIGRRTDDGAALGGRREAQTVDLDARDGRGGFVVPAHAHIRLAGTRTTLGSRIYRRSWNYDDGVTAGERSAGLMFLAWQADPRQGFIPIQRSLDRGHDRLSGFIEHIGSGCFAVPARGDDDYVGQRLLEA